MRTSKGMVKVQGNLTFVRNSVHPVWPLVIQTNTPRKEVLQIQTNNTNTNDAGYDYDDDDDDAKNKI